MIKFPGVDLREGRRIDFEGNKMDFNMVKVQILTMEVTLA